MRKRILGILGLFGLLSVTSEGKTPFKEDLKKQNNKSKKSFRSGVSPKIFGENYRPKKGRKTRKMKGRTH